MEIWSDSELGAFELWDSGERYVQEGKRFKGFEVFAESSEARFELPASRNGDVFGPPSAPVIALASMVLANLPALVAKAVEALWGDFNGEKQYRTGMWWHGGIDEVLSRIGDDFEPTDIQVLYQDLMPVVIKVRDEATATIGFASLIDDDGIGVLTDGKTILGTGYESDQAPFLTTHC